MSLKPPKKSDLGKTWMNARRDRTIRMNPEYHLIVTEGTETEPKYFRAIKNIINEKYRGRISLEILGAGNNTLNLLEIARKKMCSSAVTYRHIWVVYDTDDFPAEHIDKTQELCEQYTDEDTEYHAIWSNQCIELWYLLHFCYVDVDLHRTVCAKKLSDCLEQYGCGAYQKNRDDMYKTLQPYMHTAIRNAKKLNNNNEGRKPSESAPGTKVYELIEKLIPYLK